MLDMGMHRNTVIGSWAERAGQKLKSVSIKCALKRDGAEELEERSGEGKIK